MKSISRRCALRRDTVGRCDVQNRRFAVAKLGALVSRRHEAGAPLPTAAGRLLRIIGQHDVAGQVVALGAQAVEHPGAEAGPAHQNAAGVHLADAADVGQPIGPATADHGNVVDAGGDFRIPIADPNARLAVLLELALAGQQRREGRFAHRRHRARKAVRAAACRRVCSASAWDRTDRCGWDRRRGSTR